MNTPRCKTGRHNWFTPEGFEYLDRRECKRCGLIQTSILSRNEYRWIDIDKLKLDARNKS